MAIKTFTTGEVLTAADTNSYLNDGGLVLITSGITVTSAGGTAATVSNGTVTVGTNNTSVTVSGAFSAIYDNYRISYNYGDASLVADLRFSLGGITTGWYANGFNQQAGSSALNGSNNANTAFAAIAITETDHFNVLLEIHSPFLTKPKFITSQFGAQGSTTYVGSFNGVNNSTTSSSSFTFAPSGGTLTGGIIRVYGYRKP